MKPEENSASHPESPKGPRNDNEMIESVLEVSRKRSYDNRLNYSELQCPINGAPPMKLMIIDGCLIGPKSWPPNNERTGLTPRMEARREHLERIGVFPATFLDEDGIRRGVPDVSSLRNITKQMMGWIGRHISCDCQNKKTKKQH